jgi:hypothetical protein
MPKKIYVDPPKKFANYKKYKQALRTTFDHACVYCDIWESELGGRKSFHIDHYKPQGNKKFKHLIAEYSNLLYSCRDCNGTKDEYWPNLFEQLLGKVLLNPYDHAIEDHIDKSEYEWVGISREGIFTVDELEVNAASRVSLRELRDTLRELLSENTVQLHTAERTLQLALIKNDQAAVDVARGEIQKCQRNISLANRTLAKKMD